MPGSLFIGEPFISEVFSHPSSKCIAKEDADYVLREVHEGVCGNHIEARALAGKVLRQGYYCPTMLRDATKLVRNAKFIRSTPKSLTSHPSH